MGTQQDMLNQAMGVTTTGNGAVRPPMSGIPTYRNPYESPWNVYGGPANHGSMDGSQPGFGWNGYSAGSTFNSGTGQGGAPWSGAHNTTWGTLVPGSLRPLDGNGYINAQGGVSLYGTTYPVGSPGGGGTQGMFGAADDGRRDFVHDDYTNSALNQLQGVASGKNLPYDATTRSNMLSHAGEMNAAAEQAQSGQLRNAAASGGASLNDPSMQAAQRELMSRRQSGNASAAQQIDSQANLANFNAQQDANNQMAALRFRQRSDSPIGSQPPPGSSTGSMGSGGGTGAPNTGHPVGPTGGYHPPITAGAQSALSLMQQKLQNGAYFNQGGDTDAMNTQNLARRDPYTAAALQQVNAMKGGSMTGAKGGGGVLPKPDPNMGRYAPGAWN